MGLIEFYKQKVDSYINRNQLFVCPIRANVHFNFNIKVIFLDLPSLRKQSFAR